MSDNRTLYIEEAITGAVKQLLAGRVNELLRELLLSIPLIELVGSGGGYAMVPAVSLTACERSEKERIICVDAYSMTVSFAVPETEDSELFCYAYSSAFGKALYENPTLGGIVDRAVISGKKYVQPKKAHCGESWGVIVSLRVTVEGMAYAG